MMSAHPGLLYTIQRLLMVGAVGIPLYLLGMRGFWLLAFAFLLSGLISLFVLKNQREAMSARISERISSWNAKMDERTRAEDVD